MAQEKGEEVRRQLAMLLEHAAPGDRLPSERTLVEKFDVARETLRRAIEEFVAGGRLEKRPGVGTFVTVPRITKQFRMQSFTDDMRARGMNSSSRLVSATRRAAGARDGAQLQVSPAELIFSIRRVRLANREPMALESSQLPDRLILGLCPEELESNSLYATLRDRYGIEIFSGLQRIEATVTNEEESRLLGVPPMSPALLVGRVAWTKKGLRVEASRTIYRGDRYRFEVDLTM